MSTPFGRPNIFIKCANCSCMSNAFKKLTDDQLLRVDRHRTEIRFTKGQTLCKQGAFIAHMMFVRKGLVKIYLESADHPTIISVETLGYFIGLPSIFGQRESVYPYSIEALTDCDICQVDIDLFRDFCVENHDFAVEIIKMLSEEVMKGYDRMFNLTQKQIRGRFAELVLFLGEKIYRHHQMELPITRKDMADLISTSPESISRLIKEFNTDKILDFQGNRLEILDQEKLQYISMVA